MRTQEGLTKHHERRTPAKAHRATGRRSFVSFAPLLSLMVILCSNTFTTGCASLKSALAIRPEAEAAGPILNPFTDYYYMSEQSKDNIVLRTKKGDRAIEVEIPGRAAQITDLVIPMSPNFGSDTGGRSPASLDGYEGYDGAETSGGLPTPEFKERAPSISDREIAATFSGLSGEEDLQRREIEKSLGLVPAADPSPASDYSYLAAIDHVKRLYRAARYEAALLATDELLREYPTDPQLYEMRGTLFDRIGKPDLALRSWNQALRLEPTNVTLRRFVERKQQIRRFAPTASGTASPTATATATTSATATTTASADTQTTQRKAEPPRAPAAADPQPERLRDPNGQQLILPIGNATPGARQQEKKGGTP